MFLFLWRLLGATSILKTEIWKTGGFGDHLDYSPKLLSLFIVQSSGIIQSTQHKLQWFSWLSLYFFLYVKDHFWYKWIRELKPKTFVSWTLLYFTTMLDLLLSHSILWILYYYYYNNYYHYYELNCYHFLQTTMVIISLMAVLPSNNMVIV